MLKRIDKLVLIELLPPFLFALGAFIVLVIFAGVMKPLLEFATRYGVGMDIFFRYFLLSLPQWIVYTFPMAMLTGAMLAVGRLSSNLEVVAMRAAGVSLYRLILPFLVFALILSGVTFVLSEQVAPYTNSQLQELKRRVILEKTGQVAEDRINLTLYEKTGLKYVLVADHLEEKELTNLNLFYLDPEARNRNWYLQAKGATWTGDRWQFRNGTLYKFQPDGTVVTTSFAETSAVNFDLSPGAIARHSKDPSELTIKELKRVIAYQKESGLTPSYVRRFETDYFFRFSIPLSTIFFVLIAVPLAIMPVRTTTPLGMGFSILVLLLYIFLLILSTQIGRSGVLPPYLAAWIPNLAVLLIGVGLLQVRNR